MPYNFSRTTDYVIIDHTVDPYYAVTRASASVVKSSATNISISGDDYSLNLPVTDIGTIDGVTPADANDAVRKLGILFRGYAPFSICQ